VWSGAADLCRLQWNAATECNNIILPLAAFPLHRCLAALCNSILLFNSKRSIATSSRPRRRGDSGRSNSSKVRFARDSPATRKLGFLHPCQSMSAWEIYHLPGS
jgi:hypothetical protein